MYGMIKDNYRSGSEGAEPRENNAGGDGSRENLSEVSESPVRDSAPPRRGGKKLIAAVIILAVLGVAAVFGVSAWITAQTEDQIVGALNSYDDIFTSEEVKAFKALKPECIMVLGASVLADGTPSPMLRDRLDVGLALYHAGVAPKLLLTGDNGQVEYNEVEAMLTYVNAFGVPKEDIFLDHAGFSTYESVYRAKAIFKVNRMIVTTQRYHLFRTLYGCRAMGIEALGAGADQQQYTGHEMREAREVLARDKDMIKWLIKPNPTFLGEEIPITGDGRETQ